MPVGGSRHYVGGGLGEIGVWACPSCGEENTGPLPEGCTHCGAGKPGTRSAAAGPPPPPPAPVPTATLGEDVGHGDVADTWAETHPEATVADAYRQGYLDGVRAAHTAFAPVPPAGFSPDKDARMGRTVMAALARFRDQVLVEAPEEVATGEWATVEEVNQVITDIQANIEVGHA